jgi:KDO2-lipid IV(A) lauroyltransferase
MKILLSILYAFLWLLAWLPLWILYAISNVIFVLVYHIFRYRRKITRQNLKNAFPEKSNKEIRRIERRFYLHFCDYIVETIKLIHISDKTMRKRFTYKNIQVLDDFYAKNQNIILYLGHYGNWEWTTFAKAAQENHSHEYKAYSIYNPLHNEDFDRFMLRLRSKSGSVLVPQKKVMRTIVEMKGGKMPGFLCFIADQSPRRDGIAFWMKWLNQDTAPIVGAEKLAKQTGYPAVYLDIQKPKRGHYTGEFIVMTENPAELEEFELTKQYMRLMEKTILRDPAYWLWTHKRWKQKKMH